MAIHRVTRVARDGIKPDLAEVIRDDLTAVGTAEYADAIIEKLRG